MQEKASRYWWLTWNLGSRYKDGLEFSPGPCIHLLRKPSKILHGKRGEMLKQLHTIFTRSLEKEICRNMTYLTFFQCLSLFLCINLYGNGWKQFIHFFSDWWGHKKSAMAGKYRDDSHIPTVSSSRRLYRYLYCFWEVLCFENRAFCDSLISLLFFYFFFLPLGCTNWALQFKVQKGS